jgi:hypothetical protein
MQMSFLILRPQPFAAFEGCPAGCRKAVDWRTPRSSGAKSRVSPWNAIRLTRIAAKAHSTSKAKLVRSGPARRNGCFDRETNGLRH